MTKDDIIKAAFKVWGRDLYRTTSLSQIALELGVSKAALYRHFRDKDALTEAMFTAYFDEFVSFIKDGYNRAISAENRPEGQLILMRAVAEYYIRNGEAFIFSLFRVLRGRYRERITNELGVRGVNLARLVDMGSDYTGYPSKLHLSMTTLTFCIAYFHRQGRKPGENPGEEEIKRILKDIETRITTGLGLDAKKAAAVDYEGLERRVSGTVHEDTEDNALLRAVAGAVAEAGPWDASMEMVARRSGLSKSGLYAHFKSRQDMLCRLFLAEFTRIVNHAKQQIETTEESEEQLYLAIVSIVDYLRSRPEILVAIDWIKTRRLELGEEASKQLNEYIESIEMKAIRSLERPMVVWIANWILFMIMNVLGWWSPKQDRNAVFTIKDEGEILIKNIKEIPNESFRILFRFIASGLGGLH